jgi:cell division protein FtsB
MRPALVHRILLAVLPASLLVSLVVYTVWGDNGLMRRAELHQELRQANQRLITVERENTLLLRDLRVLEEDPIAVERAVAEDLGWGKPGATLYRFE